MAAGEPIAIIGSGCRFPGGSDTPSKLWDLLQEPRDLLRKVPASRRFNPEAFFHANPEYHGTTDVQSSYFLDEDPAEFDNGFFNIQPAESEAIDPQQRMLMETVYDSLCAAGQTIEGLRGSPTAIMVGVMTDDWASMVYKDWETLPQYSATGTARSVMSNRVSYFFDWHGPSITLDTACSSSLVAVHLAIQALRNNESRVAVAAGANLILNPAMYVTESNLHMLSASGRSRMWDKDVDGYARGEGIAAVVLKTLSAALEDGDHIECIIRATGVNQDGKTAGVTMPSATAQAALIRDTYARAGLDINKPEDRPQFFHAHGTGTPAGDPQEAEAISRAFNTGESSENLYVGSIKTIIGHTEGTAGLASLIGSSLALQHGIIPPNMHFKNLSPRVAPFYVGLEVPTSAKPWPKLLPGQLRRASVNSFGFGGTNAHAIIEAYEPSAVKTVTGSLFTPLTISAASEKSLRSLLSSYSIYLRANPQISLHNFAHTLQKGRSTLAHRVAIAASTNEQASTKMDILLAKEDSSELKLRHFAVPKPRILAVFTGQGAQWPRMCAQLIEESSFVAKRLAELDAALTSLPEKERPDWTLQAQLLAEADVSRISEAAISQPLCTAVQILLVDLMHLAGIKLHAVVGHSSGEIAAAYAAGLISANGAIRIAYYRGLYARLAKSPNGSKGAMMAVGTPFEDASEFCQLEDFKDRIYIAARNSSSSITLSGDEDAVTEALEIYKDEGKFARQLRVDTAYHSSHMQPCSTPYLSSMEALKVNSPPSEITVDRPIWHSSVHEGQFMSPKNLDSQYWVSNMMNTVLFEPAVTAAVTESGPFDVCLEIGPHAALKGPCLDVLEQVQGEQIPYTGLLSRGKDDIVELATALGFLWSHLGADSVSFEAFEKAVSGQFAERHMIQDIPKYPFDHSRAFWSLSRVSGAHSVAQDPPHPILGRRCVDRESTYEVQWRNILHPKEVSWLKGHKIQGQIVFPAAGFVAMAIEGMKILARRSNIALFNIQNLVIGRAMAFDDEDSSVESHFSIRIVESGDDRISARFSCCSGPSNQPGTLLTLNAEGNVTVTLGEPEAEMLPFVEIQDFNMTDIETDRFYEQLTKLRYEYSPPFRGMLSIKRKKGYATGILEDQSGMGWEDQLIIHPGMLDTAIQSALAAFSCPGDGRMWGMYVPVGIQSIVINPYFTSLGAGSQEFHAWEAVVRDHHKAHSTVDVTILTQTGHSTVVQLEGMELTPFTAARPENDTVLFSSCEYKIDGPDGDAVATDDGFTAEDVESAINAERVSFYYLRRLLDTITPEEKSTTLPHYQKLLNWAGHVVELVKLGKNAYVPSSCQLDTEEMVNRMLEKAGDRADVHLIESVGKNLPDVIRSGSGILEYMAEDGLFDFYDDGLGLDIANRHFARMAAQITHRYPHLKIFEIGAGTGGSTRNILPQLGPSFSSYTYTDISSGFFEAAQDRFKDFESRMIFKTFDMERPPASQGFDEGSYDLVLASNVLHATDKLVPMMTHVRQLLKPGGRLMALELSSNDNLRVGLPMGTLPGWWLGADSGRDRGPALTLPQWDNLLRTCGFSGIDTSTPPLHKLYASTIFTAQAVDDRITLLRSPLSTITTFPPTDVAQLVIIGGESLSVHRIAAQVATLLASKFSNIKRVSSIEDLDDESLHPPSTVLSLSELDDPVFKDITPGKFNALKTLWRQASNVLWVTRGSRDEEPFSFMTIGLGRVIRFEYPNISLQILDLDSINSNTSHVLAEELLRFELLKKWEKDGQSQEILWSIEPEVYIECGFRKIPRIYESKEANKRCNSYRRTIKTKVNPHDSPVLFASEGMSYELLKPSPLQISCRSMTLGKLREIQVSHFLLQTIRISSFGYLMLCIGTDLANGKQILALSPTTESRVAVPANWTAPLPGTNMVESLGAVAAHIIASTILQLVPSGSTILVHEPDESIGHALAQKALQYSVNVIITTSLKAQSSQGWHYISANLSQRLVKTVLPISPSAFINLSQAPGSIVVGELIGKCINPSCAVYDWRYFCATTTEILPGLSPDHVAEVLEAVLPGENKESLLLASRVPVVLLQNVPNVSIDEKPLTSCEVSNTDVTANIQAIDAGIIFRDDKTYFLVGLSGEVGQSLCQWMVEHGARHVVLTSRQPKVCPEFIASMKELGANVKAFSLDITKREALYTCYDEVSRTMPPIAGVANGAMVLEDSLFDHFTFETFNKVLGPKVYGTQLLDELFHETTLDFFIVFSSITGVIGNSGQSPYVSANMFMTALMAQRKKRGVPGSAIDIASLIGIGYVERSEVLDGDYFERIGVKNISEQDLHQLFAEGIRVGRPTCPESAEIMTGLQPLYADTPGKAQFWDEVKFSHFIMERLGDQTYDGKLSTIPVRAQLAAAKSQAEAAACIKESFITRLKRTLLMSSDDDVSEKASLVEQGVDSLMAVEVRSWFLKELEVDIPVLKILGGSSISDLLSEVLERVPTSVVNLAALPERTGLDEISQPVVKLATSDSQENSTATLSNDHHGSSRDSDFDAGSLAQSITPPDTPSIKIDERTADLPQNERPQIIKRSTDIDRALVSKEVATPMSYGQSRFWFLNDYLEDKTSFDMTVMFKLTGKMQVSRLERAVQTVAQRHEALRTRFFWSGDGDQRSAMQGVVPESHFHLVHKKLESEEDAKEELRKLHNHVWDLGNWEAAKIYLLSITEDIHYLLVSGHHISWDGYSFTVLFMDLDAAYSGRPLTSLGPECQYPVFSKWQIDMYETGAMEKEISSWREAIPPDSPPIPLFPFARSQTRPILDHFCQFEAKATLPGELVSKLKQIARKHRATMFHLYLAALKGLVFRLLPEIDDCFLGVADANRLDKRFMGSLGFFLNLLPMPFSRGQSRTKISDLIKDARDKAFTTLERSIVPWNVILKELKIPRTNTCAPIFQLFVDYRQIVQERSTWGGCKLSDEDWLNARNGYDLTLGITDNVNESLLSLRLQANIYDEAATHLLLRSYVHVLETFSKGVDMNASELPCWAPSDIETAIRAGTGPKVDLGWPVTVSHRIDEMVDKHSARPAIKDGLGNNLTYSQMKERINSIAAALVAAKATKGTPIGVFQDPSADCICSMLAIFRIGAIYIPLDRRNSMARLVSVVREARPVIILTDCNTTSETKSLDAGDATEIVISTIATTTSISLPNVAKATSPAIILFTSGTTGKPKGIIMSHDNLRAQCEGYSRFCDVPAKASVVLQQTIHSFDVSLDQIFAALTEGGCLVVVPAHKRGDPQAITKMMIEHDVTYTVATPSEYEMWFRYARENLIRCKKWQAAFGGGEHLHSGLIREFASLALPGLRLYNNYGPTEATMAITKGEVNFYNQDLEDHVPAGFILPNYTAVIIDELLRPVPTGVSGEIVAGGPGVTVGYLGQEEMTKEKFIPGEKIHPLLAGGTWYRTGDRGRLREDGALYVDGRITGDFQVKIRGFRIEVAEVEVVLLEAAKGALSHAVVTARGTRENRFLAAHVVFTPDYPQNSRRGLIKKLESKLPLPSYMQPAIIVILDSIPVTKNFKFDRNAVQALPLPEASELEDRMSNVSQIEKKLAALWRSIIPHSIGELTPETSFFDVGGNSIQLVKLQAAIKRTLNSTPLLVDLMNKSTLGGMARIIEASTGASVIDWRAETSIPESLSELIKETFLRPATASKFKNSRGLTVILAGATGYIGRHLLSRLVKATQIEQVMCLVRDDNLLASSLETSPKVKLISAELSQPCLNLSSTDFSALAEKADVVINCAANRSFWDGYEALRPLNVSAVKELARLCIANNKPSSFHIFSSGAVLNYRNDVNSQPPTDGSDGYVASKWAAEEFLTSLAASTTDLNLEFCIHRPLPASAPVKCHKNGSASEDAALSSAILEELLSITRGLGARPDFSVVDGHLDVIPVNDVVENIVSSIITAYDARQETSDTSNVHTFTHKASLRVYIRDFVDRLKIDDELRSLPAMNPLYWFRDAKIAGFRYLITSQHLVMSSEGKLLESKR